MFYTQKGLLVMLFSSFFFLPSFCLFPLTHVLCNPHSHNLTLPPLTTPAGVSDDSPCQAEMEDLGKGESV